MSHIIVIGAGVTGLCTAYFLKKDGHEVTVLDSKVYGEDRGCSFGNLGMVVPSHFTPLSAPGVIRKSLSWLVQRRSPLHIQARWNRDLLEWLWLFYRSSGPDHSHRAGHLLRDLHLQSRDLYARLALKVGLDFGWQQKGLIVYCASEKGLREEEHLASLGQDLGLPLDLLGPEQIRILEPDLDIRVRGGVFYRCDGQLIPERFMAGMLRRLEELGVHFRYGSKVRAIRQEYGNLKVLSAVEDPLEGNQVVLASGFWTAGLCRDLGLKLPMQAGKGYSLDLRHSPPGFRYPAILSEARVAITPMGDHLRIGGTLEITKEELGISRPRVWGILAAMGQYIPSFNPEQARDLPVWSGLRPCSPDGLPYLGRLKRYPGILVAAGHAMMGMSLGPVSGKILADLVAGRNPGHDLSLLSPERFGS